MPAIHSKSRNKSQIPDADDENNITLTQVSNNTHDDEEVTESAFIT